MRALILATLLALSGCGVDYTRMQRSTVLVRIVSEGETVGHGSGVLVDGGVLTAAHLAEAVPDGGKLRVEFYDGEYVDAVVSHMAFSRHPRTQDLALLTIPTTSGYPVSDVSCEMPPIGAPLYVVGHPSNLRWTVSEGTVITHRPREGFPVDAWLGTNTTIWRGNSGGPMFNSSGDVVGIVSHGLMAGYGPTGHNFGASPESVCGFLGVEKEQVAVRGV